MSPRVAYLSLQVTSEGQASHAHVLEIVAGLIADGWEVVVFEPGHRATPGRGGVLRMLSFAEVQWRLMRQLASFDAVYCRGHFAAFPLSMACRLLGTPIVQEVNGPYEDLFIAWPWTRTLAPVFEWLIRRQLRSADRVITVTDGLRHWVQMETGRDEVEVVPNGANTARFAPGIERLAGLPQSYAIFYGALARWQGLETLLDAVQSEGWPKGLDLVIVGAGEEQDKAAVAALMSPRVWYLGLRPYSEMPAIISNAVVGLVPKNALGGRGETGLAPLKLYETLSSGVPVVVTDFPGQADVVRAASCGMVVPPEDADALAAAVRAIVADPVEASEMGRRARQEVVDRHSWAIRARETGRIIERAIARARGLE